MKRFTVNKKVVQNGNGSAVRLKKTELEALKVRNGDDVRVTVERLSDTYEMTRKAALRTRKRYARTLEILGR